VSRTIQTPGPSEQITRRYAIKGALGLRIDEVIVPVEVIRPLPRRFCIGATTVGASAAERSEIALVNTLPFTSPGIVDTSIEVFRIIVAIHATRNVEICRPLQALSGFTDRNTKTFMDFDKGLLPTAALQDRQDLPLTTRVIALGRQIASTAFVFEFDPGALILNGTGFAANALIIRSENNNEAITATIMWSEPANPP